MQFCGDFAHLHLTPIRCKQFQHARQPINDLNVGAAANYAGLSACPGFLRLGPHSKIARRCPHYETKILVSDSREVKARARSGLKKCSSSGISVEGFACESRAFRQTFITKLVFKADPGQQTALLPHFSDKPSSSWFAV